MKPFVFLLVVGTIVVEPARIQSDEPTNETPVDQSKDVFHLDGLGMTFRRVELDDDIDGVVELFMSDTEVTNRMYKLFIENSGNQKNDVDDYKPGTYGDFSASPVVKVRHTASLWSKNEYPEGLGEHPVAFVTINQAIEFADWLNVKYSRDGVFRLPLVKEWIWSAFGNNRKYPWGDAKRLNYVKSTAPATSYPELRTPDGLYGMWGNVSELVHTRTDGYGGQDDRNIRRPVMTQWMGPAFHNRAQPRQDYWGYTHSTLTRGDHIGFRIAFIPSNNADTK